MTRELLFNDRVEVGKRLATIINSRKLTKTSLCEQSHLSRPTLDRLLAGKVENKSSFDKQMEKVLSALNLSIDEFLHGIGYGLGNNIASFREQLRIAQKDLATLSGIDIKRLKAAEKGQVELRDEEWSNLALVLKSDSRSVKGESFMPYQCPLHDYVLEDTKSPEKIFGFQGYMILSTCGSTEETSFAITRQSWNCAMNDIRREKKVVVPCLGNKLIILNTDNIKKIEFLDDDYDDLDEHSKFFYKVPSEIYILLERYYEEEGYDEVFLSDKQRETITQLISSSGEDERYIREMIDSIVIHYSDGTSETVYIGNYDMVASFVQGIMFYDSMDDDNQIVFGVHDCEESNNLFINIDNVAFIELPLMKVEAAMHHEDDF